MPLVKLKETGAEHSATTGHTMLREHGARRRARKQRRANKFWKILLKGRLRRVLRRLGSSHLILVMAASSSPTPSASDALGRQEQLLNATPGTHLERQ